MVLFQKTSVGRERGGEEVGEGLSGKDYLTSGEHSSIRVSYVPSRVKYVTHNPSFICMYYLDTNIIGGSYVPFGY